VTNRIPSSAKRTHAMDWAWRYKNDAFDAERERGRHGAYTRICYLLCALTLPVSLVCMSIRAGMAKIINHI